MDASAQIGDLRDSRDETRVPVVSLLGDLDLEVEFSFDSTAASQHHKGLDAQRAKEGSFGSMRADKACESFGSSRAAKAGDTDAAFGEHGDEKGHSVHWVRPLLQNAARERGLMEPRRGKSVGEIDHA